MKFTIPLVAMIAVIVAAPHQKSSPKNNLNPGDATKKHITSPNPWEDFTFAVDLDVAGKYWMFWTADDETETITFEVHVEALGYIGFGISPSGGMRGADVVIGWVLDDGTAVFHDRHALGESEPVVDDSQDVTLLAATQNDTHTILRFSRPYVTCDPDDIDITTDTMRVIYSYTDADPEGIAGLDYHGPTNRGTRSVVLINYNDGNQTLPDDSVFMDFLVSEIEVPTKRTTYWCEFMKIPQKPEKHHVIMFEPVIQPGNEGVVHHIVLYACYGDMEEEDHGVAWDCIDNVMPRQHQCITSMFLWAVGGNPVFFPEHTGIPFFSSEDQTPTYMRIEMHYDNPSHVEGIRDKSGIRLHMTPTLREYDAGTMILGSNVGPFMLIPPHFESQTHRGFCTSNCLQKGLDTSDENPDNDVMKVFGAYQHAHLLGRKIRTRIYREGKEIEPLTVDENYDFNFQETRILKNERHIGPNDMLVVDCDYDSRDTNIITEGGLATINEMCVAYMYYYPRNNVTICNSNIPEFHIVKVVEDLEIMPTPVYPYYEIMSPPEYVGMTSKEILETVDWTNATMRERYQELLLDEKAYMQHSCLLGNDIHGPYWMKTPELGDDWVNPNEGQCENNKAKKNNSLKEVSILR